MKKTSLIKYMPLPDKPVQYPLPYIRENRAIVLNNTLEKVCIGLAHESEILKKRLEIHHSPLKTDFRELPSEELENWLAEQGMIQSVTPVNKNNPPLIQLSRETPLVDYVNARIRQALRAGASDIHFDCIKGEGRIRMRIDGVLSEIGKLPKGQEKAIAARLKVMGGMNILESGIPQEGRTSFKEEGKNYELRFSSIPVVGGESLVLRILAGEEKALTLNYLGFPSTAIRKLKELIKGNSGLIITSGPTGSGKTTTLYALLQEIGTEENKIITLEDPVETHLKGISQIQINEGRNLSFSRLFKKTLRQDPDIIMAGEIRDTETASIAVRAALTGHLVLASLHAPTALSTLSALNNLGIDPYRISSVVKAVISQRLVRKSCPRRSIENHGLNCPLCQGTGYRGRTALVEGYLLKAPEILASHSTLADLVNSSEIQYFSRFKEHSRELINRQISDEKEIRRSGGDIL